MSQLMQSQIRPAILQCFKNINIGIEILLNQLEIYLKYI